MRTLEDAIRSLAPRGNAKPRKRSWTLTDSIRAFQRVNGQAPAKRIAFRKAA